MKTLIGMLLAVSALSPTLASAQRFRLDADAQVGREGRDDSRGGGQGRVRDGTRDDRVGRPDRGDYSDQRQVVGDRFDRHDNDRGGLNARAPASTDDNRRVDRQDFRRQGFDRQPGPRPADRGGERGYGRPDDRRPDAITANGRRAANDWTRSRFDARDDQWTQSRFADRANWNRGWRGDSRYDWNGYRTAHRGAYRLPRYYASDGDGYRRVAVGVGLQASLWNRNYWIADPYAYRLPEAYGPYRWVRYYDDALLVDLNSGRVVDAVYGIFW